MKKKIFTLLCLCVLCIGSAWGAIANPYSFTFAKGDLTTSSKSYTSGEVTWSLSATEDAWDGTSNKSGYRFGSGSSTKTLTISTEDISGTITEITVNGRSNNSGKKATISVKVGTTNFTSSTNTWDNGNNQALIFTGSASGKIEITITPDACGYILAGISVKYSESAEPNLSLSPSTIDFGDVYQGADIEAKDVTVIFANLTTNDVAAAISGSAFAINRTSSFTSGDKITITPNTETIGNYSETLTVSSSTDNLSKEVTVTMNVVAAPVMETYNKVNDISNLREGDIIVLASGDVAYGVDPGSDAFIHAQKFESSSATINGNELKSDDAYELTLAKSGDNWTMTGVDGIVGTTAAKTMTFGNNSATNTWTISISDGNASITSTNSDYGTIKYNSSSPRFLNYASGQTAIQIYKKELPPHTEAYTVTFNAGENGSCLTETLTEEEPDAGVTLPNCTPGDGYQFVGWSTNESGTSANAGVAGATYYPQEDCTLYACYAQVYKVTIEEPSNGSLVVKVGDATVTSGEYFIAGTVLNIEAIPADGYKFRNIQVVDNSTRTFTADNPKTYNLAAYNTTIKANFDKKLQYTIDYMVNGVSTGKQVDLYEDEYLVFPEVSDVGGYEFGGWKKGEGINGKLSSFTDFAETENVMPTENTTYYAVFYKKSEKKVTFDPNTASTSVTNRTWTIDNVELYLSAGQLYTSGSPKTFTVTNGTTNYFKVSTKNNEYIESLDVTISAADYKIGAVESTKATLSTSGTSQTVNTKTNNVNNIMCYATSNKQIRVTNLVVNVSSNSDYCTFIPAEVTITAAKYATLGLPYAVTIPEGVSAYTASVSGKTVTLSKINKSEGGSNVIPANCGVILYADVDETKTFTFYGTTTDESYNENKLVAVIGETYVCAGDYGKDYYLGLQDNKAVFKKLALDGTIPAGKAYLKLDAEADAKLEVTFNDEPTGIKDIQDSKMNVQGSVYNLNGVRVNENYNGIVIMNGKKYINK